MARKKKPGPGRCPDCGSPVEYGSTDSDGGYEWTKWTCTTCGAEGTETFRLVFVNNEIDVRHNPNPTHAGADC